jgi:HAD superfamily hydrolase (TIGR01509 family)
VLSSYGLKIKKKQYYTFYLGLTDSDLFQELVDRKILKISREQIPDLCKQKTHVFEKLAKTEGKIIAGVRSFLEKLKTNNIITAICSGALMGEIMLILEEAKIESFFSVIISAEQTKRGKPHPDGFLLALKKINAQSPHPVKAGQCVVIEDSYWGLKAAETAGMHTIAVTNSYDADQLILAEKIVHRLDEITITDLEGLCR